MVEMVKMSCGHIVSRTAYNVFIHQGIDVCECGIEGDE